jgi:hypothetical protein
MLDRCIFTVQGRTDQYQFLRAEFAAKHNPGLDVPFTIEVNSDVSQIPLSNARRGDVYLITGSSKT